MQIEIAARALDRYIHIYNIQTHMRASVHVCIRNPYIHVRTYPHDVAADVISRDWNKHVK